MPGPGQPPEVRDHAIDGVADVEALTVAVEHEDGVVLDARDEGAEGLPALTQAAVVLRLPLAPGSNGHRGPRLLVALHTVGWAAAWLRHLSATVPSEPTSGVGTRSVRPP